ncbi:MAG TPA: hypothetical protein EYG28_00405 [Nitrospiria bacterium]|nr:hypothetical protein [Candidatus Manganitrophaceae bacterium]HIL33859.1 hypothetical protein [Candidatus Manganitrophaceae bacterium]
MVQTTKGVVLPDKPKTQKKIKEGRGFFLALLIISGIIILCMTVVYFKEKEITIFTFQRFVINKAFMSLLPEKYTLEEAETVRIRIYTFYDSAMKGDVSEQELLEVSTHIKSILADQKVEDKEVQSLLARIDSGGRK